MLDELLNILNTVGQVVDTPWAAVRTAVRDRDIGSGLESILDVNGRATGRQMLESLGMSENQPGLDWGDVAGFAAEVVPDMLLPGAGAYKALKWLRPVDEIAPAGRAWLDAIDKAVPTPAGPQAIPEDQLMRLIGSNPIIDAAESMPLALPAPTPDAAPYYSRLRQAIEALPGENYKSQSVLNQLKRVSPEGFAQQEVEWSKLGELLGQGPMVSKQQLLAHMDEVLPSYSPNWLTREVPKYEQYSTGTGAYTERLAQHPGDDIYQSPHFPEPNPLLHLRTELAERPSGTKTLLADELQSDWHQAGRKHGYLPTPEESAQIERERLALMTAAHDAWSPASAAMRRYDNLGFDSAGQAMMEIRRHPDWLQRWDMASAAPGDIAAIDSYLSASNASSEFAKRMSIADRVADAPYSDDWPLLGLKELLRQGVAQGADEVAWLPGKAVQSMVGGKLAGQEQFYDRDLVNIANKYIKNRGWDTAVGGGETSIIGHGVDSADTASPTFRIPITPNMRRDIRERGQPLMSVWPLLAMLGAFGASES